MSESLVVLTGASGSGKTAIAGAIEDRYPECSILNFDSIGVPTNEVMASFGTGHQPGDAWQHAMTLQWFEQVAQILASGRSVLFEGQMRIAFVLEAIALRGISRAHVILVDCDDETRAARLVHDRRQPELVNESMMGWARYLRREALDAGCEVLDTGRLALTDSAERVVSYLR